MTEQYKFPVHSLDGNITKFLSSIASVDFSSNISKGLNYEIRFFDEGEHVSNVAYISKDLISGVCTTSLSIAYCQFLWLISNVSLKNTDFSIILEECKAENKSITDFKNVIDIALSESSSQLSQRLAPLGIPIDSYLDYLTSVKDLLVCNGFQKQQQLQLSMAFSLLNNEENIDYTLFDDIHNDEQYELKVNSVYCYGITFILLHELSHFELGHLDKQTEEMQDEKDADISAFWNLFASVDETAKFSANIGILCALFSLLLINPTLEGDETHPREDNRVFQVYDEIKNENKKYGILIKHLFDYWGKYFSINGYPSGLPNNEDSLEEIRSFLNERTVF